MQQTISCRLKWYGVVLLITLPAVPLQATRLSVTASPDSVSGSLRTAAEQSAIGDTIVFNVPMSDTIILKGEVFISHDLVIDGTNIASGKRIVVSQKGFKRLMTLLNVKVKIKNISLVNGYDSCGGILCVRGAGSLVEIDNCLFSNGECYNSGGGALYLDSGYLMISNCNFMNNQAQDQYGGAIYNYRGLLRLNNDTLTGNVGNSSGGGLYNLQGKCEIFQCLISRNSSAQGDGGGVYNDYGVMKIEKSVLSFNASRHSGGGIYNNSGYCVVNASTITNDSSSFSENGSDLPAFTSSHSFGRCGGGVFNARGIILIQNSTVSDNQVRVSSINIYNHENDLVYFSYGAYGAGIYNAQGKVYVLNSTIAGNVAYASATSGSSIVGITCNSKGGGIFNAEGILTVHASTIAGNMCQANASTLSWNERSETSSGGGVYSGSKDLFNLNSIIIANKSETNNDFFADTGNRGINSIFGSGTPTFMRNCKSGISVKQVFGVDTPKLADNGGFTKTIQPSSSSSSAFRAGVRCGMWGEDTIISSWHDTIPHGVYYKQNGWYSLETDSTNAPGTPVLELSEDQRGTRRGSPPCIGAVEFELTKVCRNFLIFQNGLSASCSIVNHRLSLKNMPRLPIIADVFNLAGRRLFTNTINAPGKNTSIELPFFFKGAVLLRMTSLGEETMQKVIIK
jgi:hypothetical protein